VPNEPPSLAARLEQAGPLAWREAARLTARIARVLDRQHSQGRPHGGLSPHTVLFVGGGVRLSDPLPLGSRDPAFMAPWLAADAPPERAADFYALGRLLGAMVGDPDAAGNSAEVLPSPLAAVQRRLLTAEAGGFGSANDIAAALELAIAASEGLAPPPLHVSAAPAPTQPPRAASPPPEPVAMASMSAVTAASGPALPTMLPPDPSRLRRRRPWPLKAFLGVVLALAALALLWLPGGDDEVIQAPEQARSAPSPVAIEPAAGSTLSSPAAPMSPAAEASLEQVLAALPSEPIVAPPQPPAIEAAVAGLITELATKPCTRLELEPSTTGVRLVGTTGTSAGRQELLARISSLDDIDAVRIGIDTTASFCRIYDLLAQATQPAVPRLFDLFPSRSSYRLEETEPLIVRVLTPGFPSHLSANYFTADGMVVHLTHREPDLPPYPPFSEVTIGDPMDGHWLTIAEPYGTELIVVIASEQLLFADLRPRIEPAADYLNALEKALRRLPSRPIASALTIETVPADR
jgi:hypothetical protein